MHIHLGEKYLFFDELVYPYEFINMTGIILVRFLCDIHGGTNECTVEHFKEHARLLS